MSYYGTEREIIENLERELDAAIEQRDKLARDAERYAYAREHFDEIYEGPVWVNDGNPEGPDYWIDCEKLDAAIDAAMKECGK